MHRVSDIEIFKADLDFGVAFTRGVRFPRVDGDDDMPMFLLSSMVEWLLGISKLRRIMRFNGESLKRQRPLRSLR